MDFLVLMRAVQPMPLTNAQLAKRAFGQLDYWERLKGAGKVPYTAPYVGRRARVAIYRVEALDELMQLISEDPMFPFMEREVIPLGSGEELRKVYQALKDQDDG
jgi:muconolactone delta-isomerase